MSVDINICIFICQYKQIWCRSNKVIKSNHIFTFLIPFPSTPYSYSFPLYCTQELSEVWGSRNHSQRPPWALPHASVNWQVITAWREVTFLRVLRGQWGELCFVSKELKVGSVILNETYTEVKITLAFMEGQGKSQDACVPALYNTCIATLSLLSISADEGQPDLPLGVSGEEGMETGAKRKLEPFPEAKGQRKRSHGRVFACKLCHTDR